MQNLLGLLWVLYVVLTIVMCTVMVPTMIQDIREAPEDYKGKLSLWWVVLLLLLLVAWPIVLIFTWLHDRRVYG